MACICKATRSSKRTSQDSHWAVTPTRSLAFLLHMNRSHWQDSPKPEAILGRLFWSLPVQTLRRPNGLACALYVSSTYLECDCYSLDCSPACQERWYLSSALHTPK